MRFPVLVELRLVLLVSVRVPVAFRARPPTCPSTLARYNAGTFMEDVTVIDEAAEVDGRIQGKDARILGRFKGELQLSGRLSLGEDSKVEAKCRCESAEIAGEFTGELLARKVTLLEKARVHGTLNAEVLAIRDGAVVNASVETGPTKSA